MKIVIQRVLESSVTVDGETIGSIGPGMMILLGVAQGDSQAEADLLVRKTAAMRIFPDDEGVMNRSVTDVSGDVLVVSQFTLCASVKKGNRPSYINAARPEIAEPLYEYFCRRMSEAIGRPVAHGRFGADMKVSLVNDGPVTIIADTTNL